MKFLFFKEILNIVTNVLINVTINVSINLSKTESLVLEIRIIYLKWYKNTKLFLL